MTLNRNDFKLLHIITMFSKCFPIRPGSLYHLSVNQGHFFTIFVETFLKRAQRL